MPNEASPARPKSEATRRAALLDRALALFQKRGVEATTMRDIAKAAGMSLGAAYYYFPSKEALVFAYYEDNQEAMEEIAERRPARCASSSAAPPRQAATRSTTQRHMLGDDRPAPHRSGRSAVGVLGADPAVRERAIAVLEQPLRDAGLARESVRVVAHALWLFSWR